MNARQTSCRKLTLLLLLAALPCGIARADDENSSASPGRPPQYACEGIEIAAASADEPLATEYSVDRALLYVEQGALAWTRKRKCISCHTNGAYLEHRPALASTLGAPANEIRQFFIGQLEVFQKEPLEELRSGIAPTQVAYLALGLAEWDLHVAKALSPETERALQLMFLAQADDGSWSNDTCWPPYESSPYHATTTAAMAIATAPGWLEQSHSNETSKGIGNLRRYLRDTTPPHKFAQVLLLRASLRLNGLLEESQQEKIVDSIWQLQQADGGWSTRSFAEPNEWGNGNRTARLQAEVEPVSTASDGHQTGLAIVALAEAGVTIDDDPRLARGVQWLKSHQRQSGRWWTRSLNTDRSHYITYSGTLLPLLALEKTGTLAEIE
ncbi:MAG: squalene-hopene/tetraprenyl-beta-curcumene cyclase [Verrucomicrobiales bacterium]|jgi:squalene-hopene/tetraprenyl-beta-curcumene cyclase